MPSSGVGRLSVAALVASVVAIALNAALVMPFTESRGGLDTVQSIVNAAVALCLLASGVSGAWAVVRKHERSWVVFLAIALALVVLAFEIVEGFAS